MRLISWSLGVLLVIATAAVSNAIELTGEFEQTNRQPQNATLCPTAITAHRISNTAFEIYGPISADAYGVTPFGDEGLFIFTRVNQGVQSQAVEPWLIEGVTTLEDNFINYDHRKIDEKSGRTMLETRVQWSVFGNGSATLTNNVLVDNLHDGRSSSTPAYCTYRRTKE